MGAIAELFDDAIDCLANEAPVAYAAMLDQLGDRRIELSVDDEIFLVDLGATPLRGPILEVTTSVSTLCALVQGDVALWYALHTERLDIIASPADLVAAASAATMFVQGALRCASMPLLLGRLVTLRKDA